MNKQRELRNVKIRKNLNERKEITAKQEEILIKRTQRKKITNNS
jgi:hypothetical protein